MSSQPLLDQKYPAVSVQTVPVPPAVGLQPRPPPGEPPVETLIDETGNHSPQPTLALGFSSPLLPG
jgi:hypothetical protein